MEDKKATEAKEKATMLYESELGGSFAKPYEKARNP
jgi:hypothetical protein